MDAEHTPGGRYGSPKTTLLSTKNIRQNKKPIMYNIYKYTTHNNIYNINIIDKYIAYK